MRANGTQALIFQLLLPILVKYFTMKGALALPGKILLIYFYDIVLEFHCDSNCHLELISCLKSYLEKQSMQTKEDVSIEIQQ